MRCRRRSGALTLDAAVSIHVSTVLRDDEQQAQMLARQTPGLVVFERQLSLREAPPDPMDRVRMPVPPMTSRFLRD
jgi:hypothetical protein